MAPAWSAVFKNPRRVSSSRSLRIMDFLLRNRSAVPVVKCFMVYWGRTRRLPNSIIRPYTPASQPDSSARRKIKCAAACSLFVHDGLLRHAAAWVAFDLEVRRTRNCSPCPALFVPILISLCQFKGRSGARGAACRLSRDGTPPPRPRNKPFPDHRRCSSSRWTLRTRQNSHRCPCSSSSIPCSRPGRDRRHTYYSCCTGCGCCTYCPSGVRITADGIGKS